MDCLLNFFDIQHGRLAVFHNDFASQEIQGLNTGGAFVNGMDPDIPEILLQWKVSAIPVAVAFVLIALGATTAQAGERNTQYLDACRAELHQYYGEDRELAVVSKRRVAEGTRVTISARSDSNNAEFVNCWIPNTGASDSKFSQGADTVAASVSPVPLIR